MDVCRQAEYNCEPKFYIKEEIHNLNEYKETSLAGVKAEVPALHIKSEPIDMDVPAKNNIQSEPLTEELLINDEILQYANVLNWEEVDNDEAQICINPNDTQNVYKCHVCAYESYNKYVFQSHTAAHTGKKTINVKKPIKCKNCDFEYFQKNEFFLHVKMHHATEMFNCPLCDFISLYERGVEVHLLTIHKNNRYFMCGKCSIRFSSNCRLRKHMAIHDGEKRFECDKCDYKSVYNKHLQAHKRNMHKNNQLYECKFCDYKSFVRKLVMNHFRSVHLKDKPYKCEICEFRSSKKYTLTCHREKHTRKYNCELCKFSCCQKNTLEKHSKNHTDGVTCYICNRAYKAKWYLIRHMKKHVNQTEASVIKSAKMNDKTVPTNSNMENKDIELKPQAEGELHKTHEIKEAILSTKKKSYPCTICTFKTSYSSNYNRHMQIHTKENLFQCEQCDYKCVQKVALMKHIKNKH